jgi:hypothetical protein
LTAIAIERVTGDRVTGRPSFQERALSRLSDNSN